MTRDLERRLTYKHFNFVRQWASTALLGRSHQYEHKIKECSQPVLWVGWPNRVLAIAQKFLYSFASLFSFLLLLSSPLPSFSSSIFDSSFPTHLPIYFPNTLTYHVISTCQKGTANGAHRWSRPWWAHAGNSFTAYWHRLLHP